ncbi:hypothetical protein [Streptomyces sp. NPDC096095]
MTARKRSFATLVSPSTSGRVRTFYRLRDVPEWETYEVPPSR